MRWTLKIVFLLIAIPTITLHARIFVGGDGGSNCQKQNQAMFSARKALMYCMRAWQMFEQPTDPEAESCGSKLRSFESACKEQRACRKKAVDMPPPADGGSD